MRKIYNKNENPCNVVSRLIKSETNPEKILKLKIINIQLRTFKKLTPEQRKLIDEYLNA